MGGTAAKAFFWVAIRLACFFRGHKFRAIRRVMPNSLLVCCARCERFYMYHAEHKWTVLVSESEVGRFLSSPSAPTNKEGEKL